MSCCLDIMYSPYSSYFPPYQRQQQYDTYKKPDASSRMQEHFEQQQSSRSPSTCSDYQLNEPVEDSSPKETRYLTANCMLISYFSGDISAVVDDHFTRALSQPSSYSAENQGSRPPDKDASAMAQRNFPASFWNCAYQSHGGNHMASSELSHYSQDPYGSSLHHGVTPLQDPWSHYSAHYNPRTAMDLQYTGSSRYGPHYGSLLMPSHHRASSRISSTVTSAQCNGELSVKSEHWAPAAGLDYTSLKHESAALAGLEGSVTSHHPVSTVQDGNNGMDLYWF